MKLSKAMAGMFFAFVGAGCVNVAFADHFTVNGSKDGDFSISGIVYFGELTGPTIVTHTFFPDGQTDTDIPSDNGLPATVATIQDGQFLQYACSVEMVGSVVGGVASVTSMSVGGNVSGTNYQYCRLLVPIDLPWRLHVLSSPGAYSALLEGVGFQRAGSFTCSTVPVGVSINAGQLGFSEVNPSGCFLYTPMAIRVTPTLQIVSD